MSVTTLLRALAATLFAALAVGCAEEDAESPGRDAKILGGNRLTPSQVSSELRAAGFDEAAVGKMLCTAKYESNYYDGAMNRSGRSIKRGLFQIANKHIGALAGCPDNGEDLYDAASNARCARAIFDADGIEAWDSYTLHRAECDRTKAPPAPSAAEPAATTTTSAPAPTDDDVNEAEGAPAAPEEAAPPPAPAPDATPVPAPAPPKAIVGGCFSNTLGDTMEPLACVESKFDKVWQQCKDGKWFRGGDDTNGRFGPCNGSFPLP